VDVLFNCPECGKSLAIDEKGRGLTVTCPDCRSAVVVPNSESQGSPVGVPFHDPPEVPRLRFRQEVAPTKDCPYCREPIPFDSLFCTHCGTDLREGRPRPMATPTVRFNASWVWLVLLAGLAYYGFRERQWIMERIHDWGFFRQAIEQVDPLLDLKIRANKGDRDAQFELANALCSSTGTVHDAHQAFQFYLKAADGGHGDAQGTVMKALMGAWRPETNAPVIWAWLREEAEGGNSEACYQLGLLYNMSEAFGIDQKAAVPWFKKASDGGHQEAMFTMAKFYYAGELVATNRGESARLLALVDPKRLPRAPEVLGLMTLAGDGVAKDIPKGILLLETAATNGRAQAATTLGRIYLTGEAVPKDEHKALQWFLRAGELGDARGMAKAGLLCGQASDVTLQKRSHGLIFAALSNNQQAAYSEILTHVSDSVVKELEARNPPLATNSMVQFRRVNGTLVRGTLKELGAAGPIVLTGTNTITVPFTDLDVAGRTRCDLEFRSLLSRSFIMERIYAQVEGFKPPEPKASTNDLKSTIRLDAEKGDADYQAYLGSLLLKDRGTATEGIEWLKKAAESGAPDGQYELGLAYYKGTGVAVDKQEAFRLFDLAADQDHADALLASGQMLIAGAGCLKDEVKGFQRLRESALLWESDAILATGRYLYGDRWGSPDAAQAFAWFRLGSILGMPVAQYWLGRMYYDGKGVSADYNRAIQWLSESASQGYQPAADLLNNDAAHKSELAAARQDYLKEQADFSKRLEHIRTNPKYDTIVPAQRIPSAFGNSREKEAYQRFADNYMNRRFSSIGAAVDDAWRNVGRRSHGYASNIQFIRGDLGNERFREAVQGAMQGVIDWSEVEAYSRQGSTEPQTSYRPSVGYARSRSYQDEVEQTLWAGWLEAVQAAAMYPDLIQE
jgi:TPR repeat protein/predicted nucleic acid-binding Zn ribbon protein/DNA-directed RNA polymerase subunit RPC12/RpoP